MEEHFKEQECFLVREELIWRLPELVSAASEACRRGSDDMQLRMAALPRALGARCTHCGFVLSGEELLVFAGISEANEKSAMLKRLRAGQCAHEGCPSLHYRLFFYDAPQIKWSALFAESRPGKVPQSAPVPDQPQRRIVLRMFGQIGAAIGICLLVWLWWQWHSGGRIPILREPEHFRVTPGQVDDSTQ